MQMKQLEYIVKIAECGSISKAAQLLFVSQPSLTKSVMQLEQEYGIQILIRKARGVELTPEGKSFIHYARGVLTAARVLESTFSHQKHLTDTKKSRLFLASQQLDFVYDLMLKTYQLNRSKRIHYNLVETDRNAVTGLLLSGAVDLGLFVRSDSDAKTFFWHTEAKRLNQFVIDRAEVYACIGPKSPYYEREEISFSEAEGCFQLVLDMEAQAKEDLYFDNTNVHFNTEKLIFFNSVSACERFLLKTDALLFVSKWTMGCFRNPRIHGVRVVPGVKSAESPVNELVWIKRAGEPLNFTEKQFIHLLYQHFGKPEPELARQSGDPGAGGK